MAELLEAQMISIVDDSESVREATKRLLRSHGYGAATFASAEDFLQSDQVNDTSCLITDVQMPGLSGVELQSRLIAQGNRMPIIFVTASTEEKTRAHALKAGGIGFLTKPFNVDRLIECIHTALANHKFGTVES
jgi:FixJ family two-component response regulator